MNNDDETIPDTIDLPIDGELDLHTFQPREVKNLIHDYVDSAREKGLTEIRIVHGKGTGTLRKTVQAVLSRHPDVRKFYSAPEGSGGWGATIAVLKPIPA
jgi:dsDNA-specific endonuclease/ATPase MutS2